MDEDRFAEASRRLDAMLADRKRSALLERMKGKLMEGYGEAKPDKTAAAAFEAHGIDPYELENIVASFERDRMRRTFPIPNKYHFLNKNSKQAREEILRVIKEGDVKASPVDIELLRRAKILYPPEENPYFRDLRLNNFKRKFYRNNPDWETEEKELERRIKETDWGELSSTL